MSPVEDDPDMWAAAIRFLRQILKGMEYMTPFVGPAFLGAVLSVTGKSYRNKGVGYWVSAVFWSTMAGCVFTPALASVMGLEASGSTASFVSFIGHEAVGSMLRKKAGVSEPWDGTERRSSQRPPQ